MLETRPFLEGRKTAQELANNNLDVHYFIDNAARVVSKKADVCFLPCNHISSDGRIYAFMGAEMIAELCYKRNVQLFVVTNSWKLDAKNRFNYEERAKHAIWEKAPNNVKINTHEFEKINPSLVKGIISELGVLDAKEFIKQTKENYLFIS